MPPIQLLDLADTLDDVLKVLNISSGDKIGSRFNGFDWMDAFRTIGVESTLAVHWNHNSSDSRVTNLAGRRSHLLKKAYWRAIYLEYLKLGKEDGDYPWAKSLFRNPNYKNADLVHFQIIHDGTLDFKTISRVMREKPTLWTWHDPWPLTGHCVYPETCERFNQGCGSCPDLHRPFNVSIDLTRENKELKKSLIAEAQSIHISTDWFKDFVLQQHPEINSKITKIPFGLESGLSASSRKGEIRASHGITDNQLVVGCRATTEPQKNFSLIERLLESLEPSHELVILTIQDLGLLKKYEKKFKIIEIPWTNDTQKLADFYSCLDVFLMPSRYETFGFMGLEAQSAGIPVIGFAGTAMDEVCSLNLTGFQLRQNSVPELSSIINKIQQDRITLHEKSVLSQEHFAKNFSMYPFLNEMKKLYLQTIEAFNDRS